MRLHTLISAVLVGCLASSGMGLAQSSDLDWGLRNISPESSVIVASDGDGGLTVFQKAGVADVRGGVVTFTAGAFVLLNVDVQPSPSGSIARVSVQAALSDLWKEMKASPPAKETFSEKWEINGVAYVFSGRAVAAKNELRVQLREILMSG